MITKVEKNMLHNECSQILLKIKHITNRLAAGLCPDLLGELYSAPINPVTGKGADRSNGIKEINDRKI